MRLSSVRRCVRAGWLAGWPAMACQGAVKPPAGTRVSGRRAFFRISRRFRAGEGPRWRTWWAERSFVDSVAVRGGEEGGLLDWMGLEWAWNGGL